MSVEIWYLAKVISRGEGSTNGTALSVYLVLDENANVVDIQEKGTLSKEGELPRHLIETATAHPGYWKDEDEQEFWQQWVMYPEVPETQKQSASSSVRELILRSVSREFKREILASSDRIDLYLQPLKEEGERIHLMQVEILRIDKTQFTL